MSDPGVAIRRLAGPADAALFRRLRLEALAVAPEAFGSSWEVEAPRPLAAFAERLASSTVLAAFAAGAPVGLAGLRREDSPRTRHKAVLWGVFVARAARGRGVGAALLHAVLAAAPPGVEQVTLAVTAANRGAIALYERAGFVPYGLAARALKDAAGYADEVLMLRELDPPPA